MTLFWQGTTDGFSGWLTRLRLGLADRAVSKGEAASLAASWGGRRMASSTSRTSGCFSRITGVYFVWCCVRERKLPWKGTLMAAAAFTLIGLPSFRNAFANSLAGSKEQMARGDNVTQKGASDKDKRWECVTNWSMPPEDTLEFLWPRVHGDTSCPFVLSVNCGKALAPTQAHLASLNAKQGNYRSIRYT